MGGATDLHLVERERIRWLLEEHDLQRDPSRIDQATAVQAGRLLGAQTVVFGSFIVNGRDLIVSARLVEVETGRIVFSEQNRGRADRFDEIIEQLSLQVTRALNVELASADVETRSLDAALAYSEGLALIEQGDYAGAQGKFSQALQYDPNYGRARERVQSLAPLLASR
jgi:tetratricopeptide (TPR) repeat protein